MYYYTTVHDYLYHYTIVHEWLQCIVLCALAGVNQQPLVQGQHGLITIPVTSGLAQQLLAANSKRQQQQSQPASTQQFYQIQSDSSVSVSQAPNASNPTAASHLSLAANTNAVSSSRSPAIGQLLSNQQSVSGSTVYRTQVPSPSGPVINLLSTALWNERYDYIFCHLQMIGWHC